MYYLDKLLKLFHYKHIDEEMVSRLYALSQKSLSAVIVFSLIMTYTLYPVLEGMVVLWMSIMIVLSLLRIYLAHLKETKPDKFNLLTWYKIFVLGAFSTATLFSLIGSFGLFYLDEVRQFFVVTVLVGLTAGSMSSLFPDIRIVIGYISIILIPLIVSLLLIDGSMHMAMFFLVTIYFITQIIIISNTYKENSELEKRKEEMHQEQLKLLKKEEALDYFFEQAPIGIFSYDMEMNVTECNQAFLELFGLDRKDIIGNNLKNLPDQRPFSTLKKALHHASSYSGPYTSMKGFELWVEAQCFPAHNNHDDIIGGICLIEDKTKEHQALNEIAYLASHDPLTSLLNRRGLKEYVNSFMQEEKHSYMYSLLVYLDLNKFKHINDSLGHKAGDKLLISIANRLKIFVKDTCLVSRFGGDEFIIVSPFVASSAEAVEKESNDCIERIQKTFVDPFPIDDMNLSINTSLGIVVIEPNSNNIDELIRYADIAMYQAKKNTSEHISYYDTTLDRERKKIFTLQHDLVYATDKKELKVYLQPLVKISDDSLVAAEALLRWDHPTLGFLSPVEFIPIAIETGQIAAMTWWLIDEICQYIADLKEKQLWRLDYISININAKQLLLNNFVDEFVETLAKYDLGRSDILIEITERSIIDNFEDTQDVITALREEGVKCAIDDFGIGYSSLSYLKKLSFDTLKIDMAFIKDINTRPEDMDLVKTIINIAKLFKYRIVVEGIEEEKQKELLIALDENIVYQGYLFSQAIELKIFSEKYCHTLDSSE
ncbi:MAG TPA: EAL domain-containing protein [Sulfurovum sp.]|nr:EAL domain-containing protein [Sulfurovum sp.]